MAVLEAVRGWEELAGLPHINDVGKDKEGENKDEPVDTASGIEEPLEEGMWTADQLEHQLDGLLNTDYVSLLLEHEEFIQAPVDGSIRACYSYPSRRFNLTYSPWQCLKWPRTFQSLSCLHTKSSRTHFFHGFRNSAL